MGWAPLERWELSAGITAPRCPCCCGERSAAHVLLSSNFPQCASRIPPPGQPEEALTTSSASLRGVEELGCFGTELDGNPRSRSTRTSSCSQAGAQGPGWMEKEPWRRLCPMLCLQLGFVLRSCFFSAPRKLTASRVIGLRTPSWGASRIWGAARWRSMEAAPEPGQSSRLLTRRRGCAGRLSCAGSGFPGVHPPPACPGESAAAPGGPAPAGGAPRSPSAGLALPGREPSAAAPRGRRRGPGLPGLPGRGGAGRGAEPSRGRLGGTRRGARRIPRGCGAAAGGSSRPVPARGNVPRSRTPPRSRAEAPRGRAGPAALCCSCPCSEKRT